MLLMRALYRTVAAISVALPLVVAGSSIANASTGNDKPSKPHHKMHHKMHKMHHKSFKFDVDQDISQTADQSNSNGPFVVSGNDNQVVTEQENEALQSATQSPFQFGHH